MDERASAIFVSGMYWQLTADGSRGT